MDYKNLRNQSIEDVLNSVQQLAAVGSQSQVQSIAAVFARLTIELAGSLESVRAGLHDVKKSLAESSAKVERTLADASEGSSKQTAALVTWTKVLVFATIAYTLLTGGLLIATILK